MTRFFRNYGRTLVLVVMSMLLVIFLIGDYLIPGRRANRAISRTDSPKIGSVMGEVVHINDVEFAERDAHVFAGFFGQNILDVVRAGDDLERGLALHLLALEAERAGVRVGSDRITEMLKNNSSANQAFAAIMQRFHLSQEGVFRSIGRILAIIDYAGIQNAAVMTDSIPRQEVNFREMMQQAEVKASVIDAHAFLGDVPPPTEEELTAHFEACKSNKDAHTEDALAYGYMVPDKVVVEYATVDPKAILNKIQVREKEVERFYNENKQKYQKPADLPSADPTQRPPMIQMTYEEAKARVREDVRMRKAAEETQSVMNALRDEMRRPWEAMAPDDKGVRPAPPADKQVSLEELAAKFADRGPVTFKRTELIDQQTLMREPGFGPSRAKIGGQNIAASQLVFSVDGASLQTAAVPLPVLRINEPGPMLFSYMGGGRDAQPYQAFAFRVTQVVPSGPPTSLDVVRDRVTLNVRTIKAFELAKAEAEKLAARAKEIGLDAAVGEATALREKLLAGEAAYAAESKPANTPPVDAKFAEKLGPTKIDNFRRSGGSYPSIGSVTTLAGKVFSLLDDVSPATAEAHKIVVAPSAQTARWVVVEPIALQPLYADVFAQVRDQVDRAKSMRVNLFRAGWFSFDGVSKRTGYTPLLSQAAQ